MILQLLDGHPRRVPGGETSHRPSRCRLFAGPAGPGLATIRRSARKVWNFTASAPQSDAASISLRACSTLPSWLIPISAITNTFEEKPIGFPPNMKLTVTHFDPRVASRPSASGKEIRRQNPSALPPPPCRPPVCWCTSTLLMPTPRAPQTILFNAVADEEGFRLAAPSDRQASAETNGDAVFPSRDRSARCRESCPRPRSGPAPGIFSPALQGVPSVMIPSR